MKRVLLSYSLPHFPPGRTVWTTVVQVGLLLIFILSLPKGAFTQNVGIGITNPSRAKLEVFGVAGSGATSAIFGSDATGISLQRNWPTIGFNQYRDVVTPGSQGKYIANGFAAIQYFDPTTGAMAFDMFPNGTANTFTPAANRAITILGSGNVGIRSGGSSTASLYVTKGTNFDGTAIFGGTQHGSYFNYSNAEHTYIRPGKDGGTVYINDVANGRIRLGAGITNTTSVRGVLDIHNSITYLRYNIFVTTDNFVYDVGDISYVVFFSDGDPSNRRILLTGTGAESGQILIVRATPTGGGSLNGVRMVSGSNNSTSKLFTSNNKDLRDGDVLTLIWDTITGWQVVSYSRFSD